MSTAHSMMVIFHAKPGHQGDVKRLLSGMVPVTRAETGCVQYLLHESIHSDSVFAFYETWRSEDDWKVHMQKPHLLNLLEVLPQHLAGEIQVLHLRALDAG